MALDRSNIRGYQPVELDDLSSRSGIEWAEANRQLDPMSHFYRFPPYEVYLGFGPDNIAVDYSGFVAYPGLDYGYQGAFPTEEQPTLPDVPPYLQGPRG